MRQFIILLACLTPFTTGCSQEQKPVGTATDSDGLDAPITEADVKAALAAYVDAGKIAYHTKLKSVELLTPPVPASEKVCTLGGNRHIHRTAVACYVWFECEPKSGQSSGTRHFDLIVVGRDNGKIFPADKGKLRVPVVIGRNGSTGNFIWAMGEDWVKANPPPKDWVAEPPAPKAPKEK